LKGNFPFVSGKIDEEKPQGHFKQSTAVEITQQDLRWHQRKEDSHMMEEG
jgi:hypothetical protein